MSARSRAPTASSRPADRWWRLTALITAVSLGLWGVHLAMSFGGLAEPPDTQGLGLSHRSLIVATFRPWWFHYALISTGLVAVYLALRRGRLHRRSVLRISRAYLLTAAALAIVHVGMVAAAWRIGVFRTPTATYVVENAGPLRAATLVNGVALLPALLAFIGARASMRSAFAGCAGCGYDLAGLPASAGACPECGRSLR